MNRTTRVMTDWGELSITERQGCPPNGQGYYYAIRKVRGVKRQIYLGKSIPCQERLEEVAQEINLSGSEWIKRHGKHLRPARVDRSNSVSLAIAQLRKIESLADARGEDAIAKQIGQVIKSLSYPPNG